MSFLDFLFGKAKKPPLNFSSDRHSQIESAEMAEEDDGFFEIPRLGMFVEYERSPSKEWVICWRDANEEGTRGGHRDSGRGIYVLYNSTRK